MGRSSLNDLNTPLEPAAGPKRFRLQLGTKQVVVYSLCIVVSLCWMFTLGLLLGRGIAYVDPKDLSVKAEVYRFLGLGKDTNVAVKGAADTFDSSPKADLDEQTILKSLVYYQELTGKASPAPPHAGGTAQPGAESPQKAQPAQPAAKPHDPNKERFTILVASLRDPENAQRLFDQLKSKGYSPRQETVVFEGGLRWNRVLLGSFDNRDVAQRFALEFNKKEQLAGMIIKDTQ